MKNSVDAIRVESSGVSEPTPEPWTVDQDPMGALIVSGPEGETVFYAEHMPNDKDCANAELIVNARKTAAERDSLKELNGETLKALEAAYEVIPPPTPGSLGEGRIMATIYAVKAAIAKSTAALAILAVLISLSNIPANAYEIRATWQLYDTETNSVLRNVTDGNRIDLHQVNRGNLALVASFTYKHSGENLHDHSAWVDWTLTHTANAAQNSKKTYQEATDGSWWPVCGSSDGEVNRCADLSTVGTLTVEAKAWFSDERTTGLLGSDSITLRIVDTRPVKRPPSRPSRTCLPWRPRSLQGIDLQYSLVGSPETSLRELPRRGHASRGRGAD